MAALWIKNEMKSSDLPLNKAIRDYTLKVRKSIS
jgi:hypothetical protein